MPAPSQLTVATLSVTRLLKEEISYEKELIQQKAKVATLEAEINEGKPDEDGNREYMLKQLKRAVEETQKVFPSLRTRVEDATAKLEEQIALAESGGAAPEEVETAKLALAKGKEEKTYVTDTTGSA
ncbi:tubulin-specific chaperone Rbl2 [Colletotrichum eremochloae]|uniref:Tubulin-specific chaperone A n=1 Tax=Colletotrichum sublineola TaxID=1173701 RepID=A0A066XD48_COLSU|nr:tubulin-specific chaperone Rbl2 [Colletotrichum sublineola]KAK2020355.1 tubulin-specific chaperone Rbl2 [Colletotrichum eremochloae]KDN65569.1 putative tubulin-specific chaperone Rbl2 [Colletotrichum sublineola]